MADTDGSRDMTRLHKAFKKYDREIIHNFLRSSETGELTLRKWELAQIRRIAFCNDDAKIMKSLMGMTDISKDRLLIKALRETKLELIKMFCKDKDVNLKALKAAYLGEHSALFFARSEYAVRIIRKAGFDLNELNNNGETQLWEAAMLKKSWPFLESMVKEGANINLKNRHGNTFLHNAVNQRNWRMMEFALLEGADISAANDKGETALASLCRDFNNFSRVNPHIWYYPPLPAASVFISGEIQDAELTRKQGRDYSLTEGGNMQDAYSFNNKAETNSYTEPDHFIDNSHRQETYAFMRELIRHGGKTPYSPYCNLAFIEFLANRDLEMASALAQNTVAPALFWKFQSSSSRVFVFGGYVVPIVSAFMVALMHPCREVLENIVENLFLTRFDLYMYKYFKYNCLLEVMDRAYSTECNKSSKRVSSYLTSLFSQPWSLWTQCFVTVSEAVGSSWDREIRVRGTGLPNMIQDMLMFKGLSVVAKEWVDNSFTLHARHVINVSRIIQSSDDDYIESTGKRITPYGKTRRILTDISEVSDEES